MFKNFTDKNVLEMALVPTKAINPVDGFLLPNDFNYDGTNHLVEDIIENNLLHACLKHAEDGDADWIYYTPDFDPEDKLSEIGICEDCITLIVYPSGFNRYVEMAALFNICRRYGIHLIVVPLEDFHLRDWEKRIFDTYTRS